MKAKGKKTSMDYDVTKDNRFMVKTELGPKVYGDEIWFTIDKSKDGNLTYDEVEFAAYAAIDKKYSEADFPNLKIIQIYVNDSDTNQICPVVSESDNKAIKEFKKSKCFSKFLVLPDATYHLTPECELWLKLKERGIYSDDSDFDFEKMHQILEFSKNIFEQSNI